MYTFNTAKNDNYTFEVNFYKDGDWVATLEWLCGEYCLTTCVGGTDTLEAQSREDAVEMALEYVKEEFEDF